MNFWIPVASKWRQYTTLADIPENVRCIVAHKGCCEVLTRVRVGDMGYTVARDGSPVCGTSYASEYDFVEALDPIPEIPEKKVTFGELPDGRCFTICDPSIAGAIYWKHDDYVHNQQTNGLIGTSQEHRFNKGGIFTPLDIEMKLQAFGDSNG
jgi:hypothetical protein